MKPCWLLIVTKSERSAYLDDSRIRGGIRPYQRETESKGAFPSSLSTHLTVKLAGSAMAFTFAAFCYMLTLVLCAALIFFVIWQVSRTVHTGDTVHTHESFSHVNSRRCRTNLKNEAVTTYMNPCRF